MLFASLQVEQTAIAYRALGDIALGQGKAADAIRYYLELAEFPADPATAPGNAYMLALAYLVSDRPDDAIPVLQDVVMRYPGYRPARELLARVRQVERANPAK